MSWNEWAVCHSGPVGLLIHLLRNIQNHVNDAALDAAFGREVVPPVCLGWWLTLTPPPACRAAVSPLLNADPLRGPYDRQPNSTAFPSIPG